jgi:cyclophilin family peptidyl-prolyl cis-trans isomerase
LYCNFKRFQENLKNLKNLKNQKKLKKMKKIVLLLAFAVATLSCKDKHESLKDGLFAEIKTNKGTFLMALEFEKAPITVANFITLAEGKNTFVKEEYKDKAFFDGLIFHRVEPDFVVQGGDPDGTGNGGPGYVFKNEISDLKYDSEGVVGMANSGPDTNTNGSQFFITFIPKSDLDGGYTIFAHVIDNGMKVVHKIAIGDQMQTVKIIRKGEAAKKFDAVKVFTDFYTKEVERQKAQALVDAENAKANEAKYKNIRETKISEFIQFKTSGTKSPSGLIYKFITKSGGKKPANGTKVYVDYAGFLEDGKLFDTSIESMAQAFGKFDQNRCDAHGYVPLECIAGKWQFIPGFNEGVAKMAFGDKMFMYIPTNLGYGEAGAGNAVPPNANIIFEVELKEKQ